MSEPFIGEIRMFAGNFAPRMWAFCDGQLLSITEYTELYSLLGTVYGGDGVDTFGLPEMRGRVPIKAGTGPGLTKRNLGSRGGTEEETLSIDELPSHSHPWQGTSEIAVSGHPIGNAPAAAAGDFYTTDFSEIDMAAETVSSVGGGSSHSNLMPFLCINFIIALYGIYPSPD